MIKMWFRERRKEEEIEPVQMEEVAKLSTSSGGAPVGRKKSVARILFGTSTKTKSKDRDSLKDKEKDREDTERMSPSLSPAVGGGKVAQSCKGLMKYVSVHKAEIRETLESHGNGAASFEDLKTLLEQEGKD
tara:strand:- start:352 stop:747 length:396 start_codon:yes stop_codon:yes gene_type:complete